MADLVGAGIGPVEDLAAEIDTMRDVLMGRDPFPIDCGLLTLMEVATVYYGRAKEIEQLLLRAERNGRIQRGSDLYKFRCGELRSFLEVIRSMMELGSRRVTAARYELELMRESI